MDDCHALRAAIEDLDEADRHAMTVAFAGLRDGLVADGDGRRARFWGVLAAMIANIDDEQKRLLAALEDNALTPVGVMRTELELPGE